MPISNFIDQNIYIQKIDEVSASETYIGEARPGTLSSNAQWRIKKINVSGTETSILYAHGDTAFDNIWDDRASLSYS